MSVNHSNVLPSASQQRGNLGNLSTFTKAEMQSYGRSVVKTELNRFLLLPEARQLHAPHLNLAASEEFYTTRFSAAQTVIGLKRSDFHLCEHDDSNTLQKKETGTASTSTSTAASGLTENFIDKQPPAAALKLAV